MNLHFPAASVILRAGGRGPLTKDREAIYQELLALRCRRGEREALEELKRSSLVRETLGDHIFDRFVEAKTIEWQEYSTQVTDWELDRYLRTY